MADREGFEPSLDLRLNTLSKRAPSTTRPPAHSIFCVQKISWQSQDVFFGATRAGSLNARGFTAWLRFGLRKNKKCKV